MNIIPSVILFAESALTLYIFIFPSSYSEKSYVTLILCLILLILGVVGLKKHQNRLFQWLSIIFSVILGPGGFIGAGGISGLLLAITFIVLSKKSKQSK